MAEEIQEILDEEEEKRSLGWFKKYWKYLLGFLVTISLLVILICFAEPKLIWESLTGSNYQLILASFGITFLLFVIKILRWQAILRVQGCKISFFEALDLILIGTFGSAITPAKVGDILRAFYLSKRKEDVKIGKAVFSVVFDRILDLAGIILIVGVTTPFILTSVDTTIAWWIPAGISVGIVIFIVLTVLVFNKKITGPVLTFFVKFISRVFKKKEAKNKIKLTTEEIVNDFYEGQKNYRIKNYLWLGFLSILFWIILGMQGCVLLLAFNVRSSPFVVIAVLCLAAIVAMSIPISISGIGIRDTIIMSMLWLILGIANAEALNLSIIQTFLNVLIPGLIGGFLTLRRGDRKDQPKSPTIA
ncbi:MAG: flippase-like domain-containing protein [Asgard group archaeon]|nr:flippase-like domain-containing protein [Asgard group archaeon]